MRFRTGEQQVTMVEPRPLGVEIDPASAALYDEFAADRSLDQIYDVWKDPAITNPTIRQRAVTVLTAPHGFRLPFPHTDQSIGRLLHIREAIDGEQTNSLRQRMASRPELAEELAQGIDYWMNTTGGRIIGSALDSRMDYQAVIKELLPIVSEATADKLFAHYPLNDVQSYWNLDSSSGYRPLTNLLYDQEIPRKYKEASLTKWFDVAEQEERGAARPREEHEQATKVMAEFLQTWTYGDSVDDDIHTQLASFLEKHVSNGTPYVLSYATRRVAEHITDEDVRFAFAWRHVTAVRSDIHSSFQVYHAEDSVFIDWIVAEANKRGLTKFNAKAEELKQAYEQARQEKLAQQAAELALQARLRA